MRKNKTIAIILVAIMIVATMAMPIFAAGGTKKIDPVKINSAILNDGNSQFVPMILTPPYYVNSWTAVILQGTTAVGAQGWTDLIRQDNGQSLFHYSNICAYLGPTTYWSGRRWDTGHADVTTGNLGGSISGYDLYYGVS